ncbi:MAG: MoxR family ATPase [bacterium]|nr:MoxR family ATPase [bacterium]
MTALKLPPFTIYRGDGKVLTDAAAALPETTELFKERGAYLADEELAEAVNVSLAVGQPLLVTGEPGCGKTRLAWSVADELDLGPPLEFYTRSTSRAQDLLYFYDAVRRFYDIQANNPRAAQAKEYIRYGPLGKAIVEKRRRVVLIDEIDKAPRDFPNDLLNEIDRMRFEVYEQEEDRVKESAIRPIVIITSNSERQLPLAFLRRCVFHHIHFPDRKKLQAIIRERLGHLDIDGNLIAAAVDRFSQVREITGLAKKPATGELLSWLVALQVKEVSADIVNKANLSRLPLWQALLKDRDDFQRLQEAAA